MLVSGKSYNLSEIFNGEHSIVIPDMQREYCWPSIISEVDDENLVESFVSSLLTTHEESDTNVQLGLLYAYESPKDEMQLCDGQQRITTLYLLLVYLHQVVKDEKVKMNIKSVLSKKAGDHFQRENRLKYAIRESTLFFLADLVNEFNMNTNGNIGGCVIDYIKKQDWYFNEYELDPTIRNMLRALKIIHQKKGKLHDSFAKFVLEKLEFLYFDMVNRTYGEEQFVVLNTTGEPLTKTENLKPRFVGNLNDTDKKYNNNGKTELRHYADLWESWEKYFWEKRNANHKTADQGFNEFQRWVYIIEGTNLKTDPKTDNDQYVPAQKALANLPFDIFDLKEGNTNILDAFEEFLTALKFIEKDEEIRDRFLFQEKPLSQIQLFEFLPLLCFTKEFESSAADRNYQRIKQFLKSRAKDENVSKSSITSTIYAIKMVKALREKGVFDIARYKEYEQHVSQTILSSLEILKFKILLEHSEKRASIENSFWEAENFKCTNGDIGFLFFVLQKNGKVEDLSADDFDLVRFNNIKGIVQETFEEKSDLMRRVLLTYGCYYLKDGYTSRLNSEKYSLGDQPIFFGEIANNHINERKQEMLLNFLFEANENRHRLKDWMNERINRFPREPNGDIFEVVRQKLIESDGLMKKMNKKLFCVSDDEKKAYILIRRNVTKDDTYELLVEFN